ncbi:MAG TPA: hypothetical protein VII52_12990 [Gemmatimonadaceae bacterium]
MDDRQIRRELRLLKGYALITTALLATLTLTAFRGPPRQKFTEIDVQRINVVEPDGRYRMVISNRPRSIGPIYKGKPFGYAGGTRPGIIFFNDEGTENGGLTFTGQRNPDGTYRASTHMSFDQFNEDQVLNLDYADNNGRRQTGFSVDDRFDVDIHDLVVQRDSIGRIADTVARAAALGRLFAPRNGVPGVARRVFLGRDPAKEALLSLSDRNGKARIRLVVDSLGTPSLEFFDAAGAVTARLPEAKK